MSDLKIVSDGAEPALGEAVSNALPVPTNDAVFTRRDLDMIKRDLISVRKDYNEIRNNMVILTHQYSFAPSKSFLVVSGLVWLLLFAAIEICQPQLAAVGTRLVSHIASR